MRRGFEMRLLLGEEMTAFSLGTVPISKIKETVELLFSIGAVMDEDGNWYEPDEVAFFAFEDAPCVVVVCKADGGGRGGTAEKAAQPDDRPSVDIPGEGEKVAVEVGGAGGKGVSIAELQEKLAKAWLN